MPLVASKYFLTWHKYVPFRWITTSTGGEQMITKNFKWDFLPKLKTGLIPHLTVYLLPSCFGESPRFFHAGWHISSFVPKKKPTPPNATLTVSRTEISLVRVNEKRNNQNLGHSNRRARARSKRNTTLSRCVGEFPRILFNRKTCEWFAWHTLTQSRCCFFRMHSSGEN